MSQFYANPYQDVAGFYFETFEEYEKGVEKLLKKGVEEFEIDFNDGEREDADLWKVASKSGVISQANMEAWFEEVEPLQRWEKAALYYILDNGRSDDLDDALKMVEDEVRPFEGDTRAYVEDYIESAGGLSEAFSKETLAGHIDYEKVGEAVKMDLDEEEIEERGWNEKDDAEIGEEFLDDIGGLYEAFGKHADEYIDMDGLVRDMEMSGDADEYRFGGSTWTISPNSF